MPGPFSFHYCGPTLSSAVPRIPAKHDQQKIDDAKHFATENREAIAKRALSRRARGSYYQEYIHQMVIKAEKEIDKWNK